MEIRRAMETITDLLTCGDYILKDNHRITAEERMEALATLQQFVDGIKRTDVQELRERASNPNDINKQIKVMDELIRFKLGDQLIRDGKAKVTFYEEFYPEQGEMLRAVAQTWTTK